MKWTNPPNRDPDFSACRQLHRPGHQTVTACLSGGEGGGRHCAVRHVSAPRSHRRERRPRDGVAACVGAACVRAPLRAASRDGPFSTSSRSSFLGQSLPAHGGRNGCQRGLEEVTSLARESRAGIWIRHTSDARVVGMGIVKGIHGAEEGRRCVGGRDTMENGMNLRGSWDYSLT